MTHDVPKPCLSRSWTDRLPCALPQGHSGPHTNRITTSHRRVEWFDNPSTKTDARVGRHTVDSITSDDLDQLYDRLDAVERAIKEAREGQATLGSDVVFWAALAEHHQEWGQRRWNAWKSARARAQQQQAALDRVRALAEDIRRGAPWTANHDNIANHINAAIDGPHA